MADEIERLLVRVEANAEQFERQIKKMNRALYGSQAETRKTLNAIKKDWKDAGWDVANDFYRPIQLASTVALGAIVGFSLSAAKRAEAVDGAFTQVFRDMPDEAKNAVSAVASEFGRLETDVKDNFTQMRSVLTALGVDAEQSLKIVDQLQPRSLDIGAFANVEDAEAFRAVISGLTGETEPLKRFGIVVNETATKAELLRLGFKGNAEQASEGAKAIARANIIMRQSAEMHGQVSRESDQLAEQQKRTRAEFTKAAEDFGRKFLPVAKDVLVWASNALDAFNKLPEGTQAAGLALLAFVAASGPVGAAITGIRSLIAAAVAARAALAALGSTPGAVGGRGGGGVGGVVGRGVLGTAALAAGLLVGTGSFARAPYRGDDLQKQLEQAVKDRDQAQVLANDTFLKSSRVVQQQRQGLAAANQRVAALQQQIQARDAAAAKAEQDKAIGEADAASRTALAQLGDFGLSEAQRRPVSGSEAGSEREKNRLERLRQQALDREDRTNRAISQAEDALLRARQDIAVEAGDRLALELEAIDRERKARLKDLELAVQQEELTQAQADQVKAAEERVRQQEEANLRAAAALEIEEERLEAERRLSDFTAELISIRASMARTAKDRQALELELLDIHQRERRQALEREANNAKLTQAQREAARALLDRLPGLEGQERVQVIQSNLSPLSAWRDESLKTAGEISEAYENVAARGLDALNDGIVDAIMNTRSLGDVFGEVAKQILADLLQISIRRSVTEPLANSLFPENGGGLLKSLASGVGSLFSGGARATGGPVTAGRAYKINHNNPQSEWFVPGVGGSVLTNGQMRGLQTGSVRTNGGVLAVTVDVSGANGDAAVAAIAEAAARRGAEAAVAQSRADQAQANAAKRYRLK